VLTSVEEEEELYFIITKVNSIWCKILLHVWTYDS